VSYTNMNIEEMAFGKSEVLELQVPLEPGEKEYAHEEILRGLVELDNLKADFDEVRTAYKDNTEEVKSRINESKMLLRDGFRRQSVTCWPVQNFETGMMDSVTAEGEVVASRRLLPAERQQNLLHMRAAQ